MGSSPIRARTSVPCIGRRILNHCATREVLTSFANTNSFKEFLSALLGIFGNSFPRIENRLLASHRYITPPPRHTGSQVLRARGGREGTPQPRTWNTSLVRNGSQRMETNSYTWNIISSSEEQRSKKLQVLEEEFSKSY